MKNYVSLSIPVSTGKISWMDIFLKRSFLPLVRQLILQTWMLFMVNQRVISTVSLSGIEFSAKWTFFKKESWIKRKILNLKDWDKQTAQIQGAEVRAITHKHTKIQRDSAVRENPRVLKINRQGILVSRNRIAKVKSPLMILFTISMKTKGLLFRSSRSRSYQTTLE